MTSEQYSAEQAVATQRQTEATEAWMAYTTRDAHNP